MGTVAEKHFELSQTQARRYMRLARAVTDTDEFKTTPEGRFRSIKEIIGERSARAAWQADIDALRAQAGSKRAEQRKLALRLIDIGFRVLAVEMHPDKGGSGEAMALLNEVRDQLRQRA